MLREFVAGLGLAERLASVRTIAPTGGAIARDPDGALALLAAACTACAEEDGADVVILGGAALAGLAARIQDAVPVPVLCSVETGAVATLTAAGAGRSEISAPSVETIGLASALDKLLNEG
jgi:Asp/Glu/hydantoin racemase